MKRFHIVLKLVLICTELVLSTTEVDGYPDIFPKVWKGYTGNLCNKINRFNKWYLHDIFNIHKKKKNCELNHSYQNSKHINQYFRMQYFRTKKLHIQQVTCNYKYKPPTQYPGK